MANDENEKKVKLSISVGDFRKTQIIIKQRFLLVGPATIQIGGPSGSTSYNRK